MKSLILAGIMTAAIATDCSADGLYWVVGSRATHTCQIVTRNPVIHAYGGGDFWFGDGPYTSLADAKLARSTISACPKEDPRAAKPVRFRTKHA